MRGDFRGLVGIAFGVHGNSGFVSVKKRAVRGRQRRGRSGEDYFRIQNVDEPQISPDGKWVAYTVTGSDLEKDEETSRIWMIPTAGGEPVPVTSKERSASHPRWSPDGRFCPSWQPEDGKDQVWTLFREGGEAVQLTDTAQDVKDYEWSPVASDGARAAGPDAGELAAKKGEKKKKSPPPWVITRRQFKRTTGYLDTGAHTSTSLMWLRRA